MPSEEIEGLESETLAQVAQLVRAAGDPVQAREDQQVVEAFEEAFSLAVAQAELRQLARINRFREIMGAPEARGFMVLASALADTGLPVDQCLLLLQTARPHEGQRRLVARMKAAVVDGTLEQGVAFLREQARRWGDASPA